MTTTLVRTRRMPKGKRNPDEWKRKPIVIQLRGTPEYKAWAERLAEHDRTTVADSTDRALALYAKHIGFTEPPPRR